MLVERQALRLLVELLEARVEPVREARIDALDRLRPLVADGGPARPAAAAARLMWNDDGDAFIERPRQERRLAEPRMADGNDFARVDVRIGDEIIDDARITP